MDTAKTMAWLHDVSVQAVQEAEAGNAALLNRLGKEPAFAYYFNNVHMLKSVTTEQFVAQYPQYVKEAEFVRRQYEMVTVSEAQNARLSKIEGELEKLINAVKALTESTKPAPKKKAVKESEPTPEPEAVKSEPEETPAAEPENAQDETPETEA